MTPSKKRCAIYTRKSSEEGLEQSFNSLHAQREACAAYIASQKHEGWKLMPKHFDDGGFSGGNTNRPALQQLLEEVQSGSVDVIVVYKVDRLTRSLADFAKMVESFDQHNVSFVSVTQQFNTTTSMGRLTLNVLLSFAQFEREVTGERIRDKIAASKQKGMWMGGILPLGYDCSGRTLVVNDKEAKTVRHIFEEYIRIGNVIDLMRSLSQEGIVSKVRVSQNGNRTGGGPFNRGALYHLLSNPVYLGKIAHRGVRHEGKHEAIVSEELWNKAAALLKGNGPKVGSRPKTPTQLLLTGKLFDAAGNRYTPTFSVKNGRRYHYYTCQAALREKSGDSTLQRIPAFELDSLILKSVQSFLA